MATSAPVEKQAVELVFLPIAELKLCEWNPNEMSKAKLAQLKTSMKEYGFIEPVVVRKATMEVIGGHHRIRIAHELGIARAPVALVERELSDEQLKALNVGLNAIKGEPNKDKLRTLLQSISPDFNFTLTGYSTAEISKICAPPSSVNIPGVAGKQLPASGSRIAQLYLNDATHQEFLSMCAALSKRYEVDTNTDVVLAALREVFASMP